MDGLLIILVLIGWLVSQSKKGKKKKATKAFSQKKPDFLEQFMKAATDQDPLMKGILGSFANQNERKPAAVEPKHEPLGEGESHMVQTSFFNTAETEYVGSLHEGSFEGEELCDPMLMHDRPMLEVEENSVYEGEIGGHKLDLSPQGLYQGIVMSEILKRPADRMRRAH